MFLGVRLDEITKILELASAKVLGTLQDGIQKVHFKRNRKENQDIFC